jgi:L-ascorbate metabolism protein UlaG (beta-lactamase superfamily)
MQIIWHGQSCFQIITSPKGKNNLVNIIIDPFDEKIGLRIPKLTADIVLVTHSHYDHNNVRAISGSFFLVDGPGEYEIKEVFVQGVESYHDLSFGKERGINTIYIIESEKMRICHLGDFDQKELTTEQIEKMGDIDILILPIGGVYTISAKEAKGIIRQIEPKIVIPMHYKIPKLNLKLDDLDKFLKIMGAKAVEPQNKLSIKKTDITQEETQIIVLKP